MALSERVLESVKRVWGFEGLRPLQSASIEAGLEGRDALTVLPTGGGKSLCYQVPPLVTGRVTIVLSPLIALMRDQVNALGLNGYEARALHSDVPFAEAREIEERALAGEVLLVYAAPERALTAGFGSLVAKLADAGRLGAFAIDEAHCISQWGHDFRPEYRRIRELRDVAPGVAMHAFTATATPRVREDIVLQLGLRDPEVLVGVFDRPNLTYRVKARAKGREKSAEQVAHAVQAMHARGEGGGTIVYCLSRNDTEELAERLRGWRLDARAYHAGLGAQERREIESRFTNESLDVVVATVAFGMGIDRSNVRLVVHATMPKSVEAYQQEAGRAGRDGLAAECLLLYSASDAGRWRRLIERSGAEYGADPSATAAQLALVKQMNALAGAYACRHRQLSEHFGQAYERESCEACDVCLGETQREAGSTRTCQIVLSAVARTGGMFGPKYIASLLKGDPNDDSLQASHRELGVHGMLGSRTKQEIGAIIDQLVAGGALEMSPTNNLGFGPRGRAVMKGEEEIVLAKPMVAASRERRGKRPEARPLTMDEKALFETLRSLRKSIAEENGVPPYVVFSDAVLREMSRTRPRSRTAMLEIKGVGSRKLETFGHVFLGAIGEHTEAASPGG